MKLDCQMRHVFTVGDTAWIRGRVTRKYRGDGDHLVDLELLAENQDEVLPVPGVATVRLMSKSEF